MSSDDALPVDGRRARRERSRAAVIDAVFALIDDGKVPPSVDQIAERSGVSVSSIFRMFDGLDDMRSQAFVEFEARFGHLLAVVFDDTMERDDRIGQLVRSRIDLFAAAGPLMALARQRSLDHPPMADRVSNQRMLLAEQAQRCLRPETSRLTPADAADLVALVDAATSPEAFEVWRASHGRTSRQIARTWRRAISALVDAWTGDIQNGDTRDQGEHS